MVTVERGAGVRPVSSSRTAPIVTLRGSCMVWSDTVRSSPSPTTATRTSASPAVTHTTSTGQRAEVLLADGTRALLSVESHLRVPADYGGGARDVYLDGEAFFDVRHDEHKPFRVHVEGGIAEDLGTEFVVRAYRGDTSVTVVVASGEVALRADAANARKDVVSLTPRQLGRLHSDGRLSMADGVDVEAFLAWTRGRVAFKDQPFARVARELERWYDVKIDIADSALADAPLIASFDNQPLDEVLRILSRSLDARYTREGKVVRFSPRR